MDPAIKKQLDELDISDLREMLKNDPMYKQICETLPEDQRDKVEAMALDFVTGMQTGAIEPILKMIEKPDFIEAFLGIMADRDPERVEKFKRG